jgi:heme exporter protein D
VTQANELHPSTDDALRAEHDELARRLAVRSSVDHARRGLLRTFFGLIATGLSIKLGWDRWGPFPPDVVRRYQPGPPLFLWIAMAVTVVLMVLGIVSLVKARRLTEEEDRLFARYRELRAALGLDR